MTKTMCLSLPAKLVEKDGPNGKAEFDGNRVDVNLALVEDAQVGDYVLVHAGLAIQKYDPAEAEETLKLLREALDLREAPDARPETRDARLEQ
jgi:hydrogenase expression/formation protein HypC